MDAVIVGQLAAVAPTTAAGLALQAIAREAGLTGVVDLDDILCALRLGGLPADVQVQWVHSPEDAPPPPEKMP